MKHLARFLYYEDKQEYSFPQQNLLPLAGREIHNHIRALRPAPEKPKAAPQARTAALHLLQFDENFHQDCFREYGALILFHASWLKAHLLSQHIGNWLSRARHIG
jgi:hypothetical protein